MPAQKKTGSKSAKSKAAAARKAAVKPKTPARPRTGVKRAAVVDLLPAMTPPVPVAPIGIIVPHELIARRAYEIWEQKVRIANDSARNWIEAEAELRAAARP